MRIFSHSLPFKVRISLSSILLLEVTLNFSIIYYSLEYGLLFYFSPFLGELAFFIFSPSIWKLALSFFLPLERMVYSSLISSPYFGNLT